MVQGSLVNTSKKKKKDCTDAVVRILIHLAFYGTIRILLLATKRSLEFKKLIVCEAEYPEDIASMVFKHPQAGTVNKDIPINISQHGREIQVSR